jgi:hypothetical protein
MMMTCSGIPFLELSKVTSANFQRHGILGTVRNSVNGQELEQRLSVALSGPDKRGHRDRGHKAVSDHGSNSRVNDLRTLCILLRARDGRRSDHDQ